MSQTPEPRDNAPDLPELGDLADIADLPDLKVAQPEIPTFSKLLPGQQFDALLNRMQTTFDPVKLDVDLGKSTRGRTFRPLLALGQNGTALGTPFGVVQLPDDTICVADFVDASGHARLQCFGTDGQLSRLIRQFEVGDDEEEFATPAAIAVDAQGNFNIVDMEESCIKRFDPNGALLAILGSEGNADNQLLAPQGLAVAADGTLAIADTGNSRVLRWDQRGKCLLVLGANAIDEDTDILMADDDPGQFDEPQGVALDAAGNLYVADTNNHRVQKFAPAGTLSLVFGQEGEGAGQLYYPERIQVDKSGAIYVSDLNGSRIQKFAPDGRFVYELMLPKEAGIVADFRVEETGHILVALRISRLVLKIEVI